MGSVEHWGRKGVVVEGGCCSPQQSTVPNATARAPSVPITSRACDGTGEMCQEPCCTPGPQPQAGPGEAQWETAWLSLLSGTLPIQSQGGDLPQSWDPGGAIPLEGTVLRRLHWGGIYILRSLQRSKDNLTSISGLRAKGCISNPLIR